jgi:hypothetical protein
MDWKTAIELFIALIKAVARLWPFALIGLGWYFRKEIADLMGRILKLEVLGTKLEAEAKKSLEIAKAAAGDETKSTQEYRKLVGALELESRKLVEKAADEIASVDGEALMRLAITDPRQAVLRSFYLLSRALVDRALPNSLVDSRVINDSMIDAAMKMLRNGGILNDRMLIQIDALRKFHKAVRHGYDPSEPEAADFVFYSTSLRVDLGDRSFNQETTKKVD